LNRKVKGFNHPCAEWYDFTTVWVEADLPSAI